MNIFALELYIVRETLLDSGYNVSATDLHS